MGDITPAHWHLLTNHLPVVGTLFSALLMLYAVLRSKHPELVRAALWAFVLVGVAGYVADTTGGGAARALKGVPGVERADVKEHIAAAGFAAPISEGLAVVALVTLIIGWRQKRPPMTALVLIVLAGGIFLSTVMLRTAYLGGAIRHPEIKAGWSADEYKAAEPTLRQNTADSTKR